MKNKSTMDGYIQESLVTFIFHFSLFTFHLNLSSLRHPLLSVLNIDAFGRRGREAATTEVEEGTGR